MFLKNYQFYSYFISIILIPFYIFRNFSIPYHYLRFKSYIRPNYNVSTHINFVKSYYKSDIIVSKIEYREQLVPKVEMSILSDFGDSVSVII